MTRHRSLPKLLGVSGVAFVSALIAATVLASPPAGSDAPPIVLKDLSDQQVNTAALAPRPLVLIFGELTHDGAKQTCADVLDVLSDPRLAGISAVPVLIIAQDAPVVQLKDVATRGRFPALILHDPKRDVFGAYRVLVVPTVVVVDGKGKVVHAMPGFLQRFKEILTESVLVAAGKETREQLAETIDPKSQSDAHETVRADRLAHLGVELTRHGLYDMAEARFTEATTLTPGHLGATLGLGELMLRQGRLDDAEPLFRGALVSHPDSADAALGVAEVQVRRGGDSLTTAEASLKAIIQRDPKQARARYLLGRVRESRGDVAGALAEYKKAAELALER